MAVIIGAEKYVDCSLRENESVQAVLSEAIHAAKSVTLAEDKITELKKKLEAILVELASFQLELKWNRVDIAEVIDEATGETDLFEWDNATTRLNFHRHAKKDEESYWAKKDRKNKQGKKPKLTQDEIKKLREDRQKAHENRLVNPLLRRLTKASIEIGVVIGMAESVFNIANRKDVSRHLHEFFGVCYIMLKVVNVARDTYDKMAKWGKVGTNWVNSDYDELCNALNIMGDLKVEQIASYGDFKKMRKFAESYSSSNYKSKTNRKYLHDMVRRIVRCILPQGSDNKCRILPNTILFPKDQIDVRCTYTPAKEHLYKVSSNRRHFKTTKLIDQPWDDLTFIAASIMTNCRPATGLAKALGGLRDVDAVDVRKSKVELAKMAKHSWTTADSMWKPIEVTGIPWGSLVDSRPVLVYSYARVEVGVLYFAEVCWPLSSYISINEYTLIGGMDVNAEQRIKDLRILIGGDIAGVILPLLAGGFLVWAWLHQLIVAADFLAAMGLYVTIVLTMWQTLLPTLTYDYKALVSRSVKVTSVEQVMRCLDVAKPTALIALGGGIRWNAPTFSTDSLWACWHDGETNAGGIHNVELFSSWWNRSNPDKGFVGLGDLLKVGYVPCGVWDEAPDAIFSLSDGSGILEDFEKWKEIDMSAEQQPANDGKVSAGTEKSGGSKLASDTKAELPATDAKPWSGVDLLDEANQPNSTETSSSCESLAEPFEHTRTLIRIGSNRLYCSAREAPGTMKTSLKHQGKRRRIRYSNVQRIGFDNNL
jgi:hypothetical protein